MIQDAIAKALNDHVSVETSSAIAYLSMASWAEIQGLSGFAAHFKTEATGELNHMQQFITYLNNRDYQATFNAMPAPRSEWDSVEEVVAHAYEMEIELTTQINNLVAKAREHNDYFTEAFLNGFIPQQITDQAEAEELLKRVRMAKDGQGLLIIDQHLGAKG
ncbi:MAG: ferritin [Planctomycetota bacterium]|nr:MAG: ferritin [Planctomycetota bacterium]